MKTKVTALIDEDLISEIKQETGAKNLTQGLSMALQDWISTQKLLRAQKKLKKMPLRFVSGFSAESVRDLNRRDSYGNS